MGVSRAGLRTGLGTGPGAGGQPRWGRRQNTGGSAAGSKLRPLPRGERSAETLLSCVCAHACVCVRVWFVRLSPPSRTRPIVGRHRLLRGREQPPPSPPPPPPPCRQLPFTPCPQLPKHDARCAVGGVRSLLVHLFCSPATNSGPSGRRGTCGCGRGKVTTTSLQCPEE